MPYNLLLLPLMGGFLFLHLAHLLRYRAQRLENYRLIFVSAVVGTILLGSARAIVVLSSFTPFASWFSHWWGLYSPFPHGDSAVLAFLLGPAGGLLVNLRVSKLGAKRLAAMKYGDMLVRLLNGAEASESMVSVTLANSKWYVGYVKEAPSLDPQERYFQILPVMSGYRRRETLETVPVVFYDDVLGSGKTEDLAITLPISDVKIANLFDVDRYYAHFANQSTNAPNEDLNDREAV